jgi:DtxR family manganese transport transcriptional regulator
MTDPNDAEVHARIRSDHATETAEDYVEAIADLEAARGACRVTDLADRFGVTHVTVIRTVQRLERDGLVSTEPYKPVTLTARGRRLAKDCKDRHDTVLRFLLAIGVEPAAAAADTEGIEHHVSPATLARFRAIADSGRL